MMPQVGEELPVAGGPMKTPAPRQGESSRPKGRRAAGEKRKVRDRFATANEFRDIACPAGDLKPTAIAVWWVVWSFVDARDGMARISYNALAVRVGLQARQVKRVVAELLERGFLEMASKGSAQAARPNFYRVHGRGDSVMQGEK